MTAITNKLTKLTLGQMVLINIVVIIIFMTINSFVCEDGLSGGECIKHLDNQVFAIQMIVNLAFSGYYLYKTNRGKWRILFLNFLLTTIIYLVAATLHSISKSGLF